MNVLIVLAHPEPRSLNGALAHAAAVTLAAGGHAVRLRDLHAESFDPVERAAHFVDRCRPETFEVMPEQAHAQATGAVAPDVAAHQADVDWAELFVLQFPLWWWSMPAILKGWMDRVMADGFAYRTRSLKGKTALLSVTAETDPRRFADPERSPLEHIERGTLGFCEVTVAPAAVIADVYNKPREEVAEYIAAFARRVRSIADSGQAIGEAVLP